MLSIHASAQTSAMSCGDADEDGHVAQRAIDAARTHGVADRLADAVTSRDVEVDRHRLEAAGRDGHDDEVRSVERAPLVGRRGDRGIRRRSTRRACERAPPSCRAARDRCPPGRSGPRATTRYRAGRRGAPGSTGSCRRRRWSPACRCAPSCDAIDLHLAWGALYPVPPDPTTGPRPRRPLPTCRYDAAVPTSSPALRHPGGSLPGRPGRCPRRARPVRHRTRGARRNTRDALRKDERRAHPRRLGARTRSGPRPLHHRRDAVVRVPANVDPRRRPLGEDVGARDPLGHRLVPRVGRVRPARRRPVRRPSLDPVGPARGGGANPNTRPSPTSPRSCGGTTRSTPSAGSVPTPRSCSGPTPTTSTPRSARPRASTRSRGVSPKGRDGPSPPRSATSRWPGRPPTTSVTSTAGWRWVPEG